MQILVTLEAIPKYCKARPIPFCQRELVKPELSWLGAAGIIEPICPLEWGYVEVGKLDMEYVWCLLVEVIHVTWIMYGAYI